VLAAIIGTDADATIVPVHYLVQIGAEETAPGWLRGITGERVPVGLYFADVCIGELSFPGVRIVGNSSANEVLLGRDVLNKLALLLDGPQQTTDVVDDAALQRLRARR
jgi:hypothetical protein